MARDYTVAVVGATGLVGQTMITVLEERNFPVRSLRPLASARSASSTVTFRGQAIPVEEVSEGAFEGVDVALFSAGNDVSKQFGPVAARAGAVTIDNSSAFRMDPDVPLVVPEVNPDDVLRHHGIIANPNCSTIQMVVALNPLHLRRRICSIIVDTYQSVSGAGSAGVEDLKSQMAAMVAGQPLPEPRGLPQTIAANLFPHIDVFLEDGLCKEEWKMVHETRKIMHAPDVAVAATTVRVPVLYAHSESVHVSFEGPLSPSEARAILSEAPGVVVQDDLAHAIYPMPAPVAGHDEVFVGRIRPNPCLPNGLSLWVVADNVRKGAATNAVQIAELLIQRGAL
ncbi:MAG TPA: aspartate-semialdehyde dehydrogenase [Chloroflexota bacterium]|nr:aspartate-semialdehyde dehydrogenase [Chloroflexota bacterium]